MYTAYRRHKAITGQISSSMADIGVASYGILEQVPPPLDLQQIIFFHFALEL